MFRYELVSKSFRKFNVLGRQITSLVRVADTVQAGVRTKVNFIPQCTRYIVI